VVEAAERAAQAERHAGLAAARHADASVSHHTVGVRCAGQTVGSRLQDVLAGRIMVARTAVRGRRLCDGRGASIPRGIVPQRVRRALRSQKSRLAKRSRALVVPSSAGHVVFDVDLAARR
jgi:hypothetical protein